MRAALVTVPVVAGLLGCLAGCEGHSPGGPAAPPAPVTLPDPAPAPPRAASPGGAKVRLSDYLAARTRARLWLDALEVDPVDLMKHGIKGKKKLAEILDCYLSLLQHSKDPTDQAAIRRRVEDLAKQAARPAYHDMLQLTDLEFTQNSMSYLRVAWLLGRFGLDTRAYREEILRAKPRLDAHLRTRGPWQQAMFLEYYDRFKLEKPASIPRAPMAEGVISRRLPAESYDDNAVYDITHEVFVAFDYGHQRQQTRFTPADLAHVSQVLPRLVQRYVAAKNADLVGELLSCMTYFGWHADPAHARGASYLLDAQNPNGTWGDYEAHRPQFGKYLDHHVYLHTTMVVLEALVEVFEGDWDSNARPGVGG